jgi:hypothetical protein
LPDPRRNPKSAFDDQLSYVAHPELMQMKYIGQFPFYNSTDGKYNMPKEEVTKYV